MSGVKIVLLCEDKQTSAFVRRFLKYRNFDPRDITTLPLPAGSQSGEQWVRQHYPSALRSIRSRANAHLIVVTDADSGSTKDRRRQLNAACASQGIAGGTDGDRLSILIPRKNIETWLAYLGGTSVSEDQDYPKLRRERDCRMHARELDRMCQKQHLRQPAPPSLDEACKEYHRSRQWK